MTRTQLVKSLRSLIVYHRSCGIDYYPDTEQLRAGLKAVEDFAARETSVTGAEQKRIPSAEPAPASPPAAAEAASPKTGGIGLEELSREISGCRICPLHESRKLSTAGRGGTKPPLMIIGDWLVHDGRVQGDELFGIEQDLMLNNMIKALNLDSGDVFITNVIKCSVGPSYRPDDSHLSACAAYLKQQIALLRPAVICTMGTAASQTLLDTDESLIGLRGKFHRYNQADGIGIDVMPTFHPTYLLKNPEMKKPTWDDLQMIRKALDKKS